MSQASDLSESTYKPAHLLSTKSRKLKKDVFIWAVGGQRLIGGVNHLITPISVATLDRWIRLIDRERKEFGLFPVKVEKVPGLPLFYNRERVGRNIWPPGSTEILLPGDYNLYNPKGSLIIFDCSIGDRSFTTIRRVIENPAPNDRFNLFRNAEMMPWYAMPEEIKRAVAERDKGHCVITGACREREVAITWLIPPAMIDALKDASQDPRKFNNYSEACVVSNAITLRKDLIEALNDNAFGIDVEDNYRIVLFYDLGDTGKFLQGLERPFFRREDRQGPDDIFLIAHFLHCVKVHVIGGDVSDEYSLRDIEVWEDRLDDEDGAEWDDPLGAEVYEVHCLADLMYT